jgi:sialate O-acetylesterase
LEDTTITLRIANPLQSNMVIQQGKPFKIWGYAPAGKTVIISADWLNTNVTIIADKSNKFIGIISVPLIKAGDYRPHIIIIESGKEKLRLTNLLIGDVWFCSGQSNMQFAMRELDNAQKKIDSVNDPNLRILSVKFAWHTTPVDSIIGKWLQCNPSSVKNFSAIGYYYGQELRSKLNIPIGIIYSGIGGSVTQAYVSKEVMTADTMLYNHYLLPFYKSDMFQKNQLDEFTFSTTSEPYLIYNAMIHPFFNLSIKGILWYQGESNRSQRDDYIKLNYALITSWRENFGQDNLPFYFVQVAPHAYQKKDSTLNDYAFFREAQEKILKMSNTAMVITMDVGDADSIHPKNKKPVALRLARVAFNRTYNMLDVNYKGPHFYYVEYSKHKAIIHFEPESVNTGLKTNDGESPKYFFMAGDNQKFYLADAKIVGNTVILTCNKIKKPVAVRYAFTNYPITNFENGDGLPAVPFRTDNWVESDRMATSR